MRQHVFGAKSLPLNEFFASIDSWAEEIAEHANDFYITDIDFAYPTLLTTSNIDANNFPNDEFGQIPMAAEFFYFYIAKRQKMGIPEPMDEIQLYRIHLRTNPIKIEQIDGGKNLTLPSMEHCGGPWKFRICPQNEHFYGIACPKNDEKGKLPRKLYQFERRNFHRRKEFQIDWTSIKDNDWIIESPHSWANDNNNDTYGGYATVLEFVNPNLLIFILIFQKSVQTYRTFGYSRIYLLEIDKKNDMVFGTRIELPALPTDFLNSPISSSMKSCSTSSSAAAMLKSSANFIPECDPPSLMCLFFNLNLNGQLYVLEEWENNKEWQKYVLNTECNQMPEMTVDDEQIDRFWCWYTRFGCIVQLNYKTFYSMHIDIESRTYWFRKLFQCSPPILADQFGQTFLHWERGSTLLDDFIEIVHFEPARLETLFFWQLVEAEKERKNLECEIPEYELTIYSENIDIRKLPTENEIFTLINFLKFGNK